MKYYPTLEFSRSLGWEIGIRTPLQESLKCGEHIYSENMKKPAACAFTCAMPVALL